MKIKSFNTIIIIIALIVLQYKAIAQSTFNSQTLENAIINYVKTENKCETKVEITQKIVAHKFTPTNVTASISHTENLIGNCSVLLTFYDNDIVLAKEKIRLNVRVYAEVPVAAHFIGKDVTINQEDIILKKTDVTTIDPNSVADINDIIGKSCQKGIAKNAVILYSDLANSSKIIIKKNDKVTLLHYSGSILIRTEGVALENGAVGSVIKVKKDNTRTLYGFVADDGNVIIEDKSKLL